MISWSSARIIGNIVRSKMEVAEAGVEVEELVGGGGASSAFKAVAEASTHVVSVVTVPDTAWDPSKSSDWDKEKHTKEAVVRIKRSES